MLCPHSLQYYFGVGTKAKNYSGKTGAWKKLSVSFLRVCAYNIIKGSESPTAFIGSDSRGKGSNLMEHILISPGKLKLTLTRDDLERYDLGRAVDDGAVDTSRLAFRTLLDDAGRLAGFDAGSDKLFIQLYPSKDGGAELYITKLGCDNSVGKKPTSTRDDKVMLTRVGVFETMSELLECCRHLDHMLGQCDIISSAYSDNKRYFLVISESISYHEYLEGSERKKIEAALGEYGRNIADAAAISYIKEHCFVFCEKRAVKILSDMV